MRQNLSIFLNTAIVYSIALWRGLVGCGQKNRRPFIWRRCFTQKATIMEYDILVLAILLVLLFVGAVIWKLNDDFKHATKGLTKLPPASNKRNYR